MKGTFLAFNYNILFCTLTTIFLFVRFRFVDNLGYPVSDEYSSWVVENEIKGVIGGFSKTYHNGSLRFTTVRGAGHMVPFDKPQSALKILNEFLLQLPKN